VSNNGLVNRILGIEPGFLHFILCLFGSRLNKMEANRLPAVLGTRVHTASPVRTLLGE